MGNALRFCRDFGQTGPKRARAKKKGRAESSATELDARLVGERREADLDDIALASGAASDLEGLRQVAGLLRAESLGPS
ncbi:hypothetical protein RNZ50_00210 [Paracoccaceae bacterium Fryx2]|nr:hypothetical protein [Paracoccaceae bacterium Fryx2]